VRVQKISSMKDLSPSDEGTHVINILTIVQSMLSIVQNEKIEPHEPRQVSRIKKRAPQFHSFLKLRRFVNRLSTCIRQFVG